MHQLNQQHMYTHTLLEEKGSLAAWRNLARMNQTDKERKHQAREKHTISWSCNTETHTHYTVHWMSKDRTISAFQVYMAVTKIAALGTSCWHSVSVTVYTNLRNISRAIDPKTYP